MQPCKHKKYNTSLILEKCARIADKEKRNYILNKD